MGHGYIDVQLHNGADATAKSLPSMMTMPLRDVSVVSNHSYSDVNIPAESDTDYIAITQQQPQPGSAQSSYVYVAPGGSKAMASAPLNNNATTSLYNTMLPEPAESSTDYVF